MADGDQTGAGAAPTVSVPKGGGAIRGMGDTFAARAFTGTGAYQVDLPLSAGRGSSGPSLTLAYDSGSGNGPFGFGWALSVPAITRKTDKGVPRYDDAAESDVFVLSGYEDLVPVLLDDGTRHADDAAAPDYLIRRYRPRVDTIFARIERWTDRTTGDVHWRSITGDNRTTVYGTTAASRIADGARVFSWLIAETWDDLGNVTRYHYAAEDDAGVDRVAASEANRTRDRNRYLKRIEYGNRVSRLVDEDVDRAGWLFEAVFDYDDGHLHRQPTDPAVAADEQHRYVTASATPTSPWAARPDPFSTYRSGFEVRTYRRCRRLLMFHRLPELGDGPSLVGAVEFGYRDIDLARSVPVDAELAHDGSTRFGSFLSTITRFGYVRDGAVDGVPRYLERSMPSLDLTYSRPVFRETVAKLDAHDDDLAAGLDRPFQRWVDLEGEGLPGVLSEEADQWWYRPNRGGRFGQPLVLRSMPARTALGDGRQQLTDLAGDGALDVVEMSPAGVAAGFYERDEGGWRSFRSFGATANVSWTDDRVRLVDLEGNGNADVLTTDEHGLTWYPSLGEAGFETPRRSPPPALEGEQMPFSFGTSDPVFLADMSGDGLIDLVRVSNGEVTYHPNLGNGAFGLPVTMDNPPWFDEPGQFDHRRIRFGDVDGSGPNDIVYLGADGIRLYLNQCGNRWSNARRVGDALPAGSESSVALVDLLGTGTASIAWWSPGGAGARTPVSYIDLLGGEKPHLLVATSNNLGAEARVTYAPSTRFAIADREAGRPSATKLPFPVHVVERVELVDRLNDTRVVTRFAYHDGAYDGVERDFRGFGFVEQWDAEAVAGVDVPPVLRRMWFHTGDPDHVLVGAGERQLGECLIPSGLDAGEAREAARALRGTVLREESYGLDGTGESAFPYGVTENTAAVVLLQPRGPNRNAVFLTHPRESVVAHHERKPDDPRVTHQLTLAVDDYGNVTVSADVAYGRRHRHPALPEDVADAQLRTTVRVTRSRFTNSIDERDAHRVPQLCASTTYVLERAAPGDTLLTFAEVAAAVAGDLDGRARVLRANRILYRRDDLAGPLPLGTLERLGLPFESYRLALPDDVVARVFGGRVDAEVLAGECRYGRLEGETGWWSASGRLFYAPAGLSAAEELAEARAHWFVPRRYLTPHGTETSVRLDPHDLMVAETTDALGNRTTITKHDYRVLQSAEVTDPNGNRTAVAYDALGMVVGSATMGKAGPAPAEGDSLDGFRVDLTPAEIRRVLDDPLRHAREVLGNASTRVVYDVDAPRLAASGGGRPAPSAVCTIAREVHASEPGGDATDVQVTLAYADGLGREVQQKARAEPDRADGRQRWITSGRVVLTNKGDPAREYDERFSATHRWEAEVASGPCRIHFYDPMRRRVGTLHPDGTVDKVRFDAWRMTSWDRNDTATSSGPAGDPDVGAYVRALDDDVEGGGWMARRASGELGQDERDAAAKVALHAGTPTVAHADALGRTVFSVAWNRRAVDGDVVDEWYATTRLFDLADNEVEVIDALGRRIVHKDYDLLGHCLHEALMDGGERWILFDGGSRPRRLWDSRGHTFRRTYDALFRPSESFLRVDGAPEVMTSRIVYGEDVADPAPTNLRTRPVRVYDQAGVVVTDAYDFKGNALRSRRAFARSYRDVLDWSGDVELEDDAYVTHVRFDALSRRTQLVSPHREGAGRLNVVQVTYNEANLPERIDVWEDVDQPPESLLDPASATIHAITDVGYDAGGQRTLVTLGNGVTSSYDYDDTTRRLTGTRTARADGRVLQDIGYTYDAVGNIVRLRDAASPTTFFANHRIDAVCDYTHDATYRLIRATGREHLAGGYGAGGGRSQRDEGWSPRRPVHPADTHAMANYVERYAYDAAGNLVELTHHVSDPAAPHWKRRFAYDEPSALDHGVRGNRLTSTTVGDETAVYSRDGNGYDAHGNQQHMPHLPGMVWNHHDELRMVETIAGAGRSQGRVWYVYDANGQRVRMVREAADGVVREERRYLGGSEVYWRHGSRPVERETLHVMDGDRRIAMVETRRSGEDDTPARLVRYQLPDHLGSTALEVDDTGEILTAEEQSPFGTTTYYAARGSTDPPKRYRFMGKERDDRTGLVYFGARYYAPWLARWTSSDPAGAQAGTNTYTFVSGRPTDRVDPDGRFEISWTHVAIGAAVAVATVAIVVVTAGAAAPVVVPAIAGALGVSEAAVVTTAVAAGTVYGTYATARSVAEIQDQIRTGHDSSGNPVSDEQISYNMGGTAVNAAATVFGARSLRVGGGGPPSGTAPATLEFAPAGGPSFGPSFGVSARPLPITVTAAGTPAMNASAASAPVRDLVQQGGLLMMSSTGNGPGGNGSGDDPPTHSQGAGPRSVDPQGEPFSDPAPRHYSNPSAPVGDHLLSRAIARRLGLRADSPRNIDPKTIEANSRKGGLEGQWLRDFEYYVANGMSERDALRVMRDELRFIVRDVHPRPVDPHALGGVADSQGLASFPEELICR